MCSCHNVSSETGVEVVAEFGVSASLPVRQLLLSHQRLFGMCVCVVCAVFVTRMHRWRAKNKNRPAGRSVCRSSCCTAMENGCVVFVFVFVASLLWLCLVSLVCVVCVE